MSTIFTFHDLNSTTEASLISKEKKIKFDDMPQKVGSSLSLELNETTFEITAKLLDQDGNLLGSEQVVDLPLESVVISGRYDSATKKVVLTLKNGSTIEFSVADLISGLQTEITTSNPINVNCVTGAAVDSTVVHKTGDESISGVKTLSSRVNIPGTDDNTCLYLGTSSTPGRINVKSNSTVLGFVSPDFVIGHSSMPTNIRGSQTRPGYNGNDLALKSDSDAKVDKSGSTMTGPLVLNGASSLSTKQARNIIISEYEPTASEGSVGDLWIIYNS